MDVHGFWDKEAGTVDFGGENMDLEALDEAIDWLQRVRTSMARQQMVAEGGRRWVFERGIEPRASLMYGKTAATRPFVLVEVTPKKARQCAACGIAIEVGDTCWRAKPGQYTGHSRDRFCRRCVSRGEAPRPPKLRIVS